MYFERTSVGRTPSSCIECKKGPTFAYSRSALAVKSSTCLFSSCFSGVSSAQHCIELKYITKLFVHYSSIQCKHAYTGCSKNNALSELLELEGTWPPTASWAVEGHAPSNLVFQFQQFRKGVSFWDTLYLAPLELCKKNTKWRHQLHGGGGGGVTNANPWLITILYAATASLAGGSFCYPQLPATGTKQF